MKTFVLFCITLLGIQTARATHLIGGFIQAKPVAGSGYEITVVLYMNEGSGTSATEFSSSIPICFGDGTNSLITRQSRVLSSDKMFSVNTYRVSHTYAGPGVYTLTSAISNWTPGSNIPNASSQLFTLRTTFTTNTTVLNQTPVPAFPPTGFLVKINQKATLLVNAADTEGDSLVYGLAKPLTSPLSETCNYGTLPNYQFPNDLTRRGIFTLNSRTGELVWDAPVERGFYTVALYIDEYRNGVLLSQTMHVLTLTVADLPGTPATLPAYVPAIIGTTGLLVTDIEAYRDEGFQLIAFPTPVDDRLQVVIQTSNPTTATLQLLNSNGRLLHKLTFDRAARRHEQVIGMGSLTPGLYLIRADIGGRSLVRKVVKR